MIIVPPLGVVDFSYDRLSGAQLQAAGAQGVIRYACAGRASVNITAAEYADYTAHGIPVGITCEHAATFMTSGRAAGRDFAQGSLEVTRAAGMPDGPVFFAVDFPADESYMPALLDTLDGCADVLGPANAGIYGSYDVIDWLVRNSPYIAFWQTAAWSNGKTHPHAWLIQDRIWTVATPYKLDGANVDFSTVLSDWHPRQEDEMNDADWTRLQGIVEAAVSNGVKAELTYLMGTRSQPKGIDPKTVTTLAALADGQYVAYHGIAGDPSHPGQVAIQAAVQEVQARVADISKFGNSQANVDALTAAVNALNNRIATIQWTLKAS